MKNIVNIIKKPRNVAIICAAVAGTAAFAAGAVLGLRALAEKTKDLDFSEGVGFIFDN